MTMKDEVRLLRATGADVTLLDSGCCGMAGPFGFEADKFEVSQILAERVLLPAVRAAARRTCWSPTASAAANRSVRTALDERSIWPRCWQGTADEIAFACPRFVKDVCNQRGS